MNRGDIQRLNRGQTTSPEENRMPPSRVGSFHLWPQPKIPKKKGFEIQRIQGVKTSTISRTPGFRVSVSGQVTEMATSRSPSPPQVKVLPPSVAALEMPLGLAERFMVSNN